MALERITTAVPWPRGLVVRGDELYALGRGAHRGQGGPNARNLDEGAGYIYRVSPNVAEPVVVGQPPSAAVLRNAEVHAYPHSPPFRLWDRNATPPETDRWADRPYAGMVYDQAAENFFICAYSGIDRPDGQRFIKNATDAVHRFDERERRWLQVEAHEDTGEGGVVDSDFKTGTYPHRHHQLNVAPRGLLAGPEAIAVVGDQLYVGTLDNDVVVSYDLEYIRKDPLAPPPVGKVHMTRNVSVSVAGQPAAEMTLRGASGFAHFDDYLYVSYRTSRKIARFPTYKHGGLRTPIRGELIADFTQIPPDDEGGNNANLIDLAVDGQGRLYLSTASLGGVWRFDPDPMNPFTPVTRVPNYVHLADLVGDTNAKCSNIALDPAGRLYICSNQDDDPDPNRSAAGTIYRFS